MIYNNLKITSIYFEIKIIIFDSLKPPPKINQAFLLSESKVLPLLIYNALTSKHLDPQPTTPLVLHNLQCNCRRSNIHHQNVVLITLTLVLALRDFNATFKLETNASFVAIRAVLSQNGHPLAFFS